MVPYDEDDNYGRKYTGFEEGYTSADNRSPRRRSSERHKSSGYNESSRFIDTGDRYTSGYKPPENEEDTGKKNKMPPPPSESQIQTADETFRERDDSLPYDEIYAPGHSRSMFGEYEQNSEGEQRRGADGSDNPAKKPVQKKGIFYGLQDDETEKRASWLSSAAESVKSWCAALDSKRIGYIFGGAIVLVLLALAVAILIKTPWDSCGGSSEIPVIEQGDGLDETYTDPTEPVESMLTNDGDLITIDENIKSDTFVVEVQDADGSYSRTNVYRAEKATLDITGQDSEGFAFSLEACSENNSGTVAGMAYFCSENEAIYITSAGTLCFRFGSSGVTVYMIDEFAAFNGVSPDGIYVSDMPTYIEDAAAQSEEVGLDAEIRSSESVQEALRSLLSEQDIALMNSIFETGAQRVVENSEKGYDKNGTAINIDAQLNAVKYICIVSGSGEEIVMICTNDARVYVGICDGAEYRYYTNDEAYAAEAPNAISGQARGKGMTLRYQQ